MNACLIDYLAIRKQMPFEWGVNDCCLFVADWILIATSNDVAVDFRGAYSTKIGAFKTIFKLGFNDVKSVFKHSLNKEVALSYAQRGDVALVNYNDELVGGIIYMNSVLCVGESGIVSLPLSDVTHVFPLFKRGGNS